METHARPSHISLLISGALWAEVTTDVVQAFIDARAIAKIALTLRPLLGKYNYGATPEYRTST